MVLLHKDVIDNVLKWIREFNEFDSRVFWISLINSKKIRDTTLIYKKYNISDCVSNNITNCISYDIYTYKFMHTIHHSNISFYKFVLHKLLKHNNIILTSDQAIDKMDYGNIGKQWKSHIKYNYKITV